MQQVQISKVNGRTCRDSFGRELVRIGNMNVNAGDIVWTDGRCVYGSIRQGSPANPLTFIRGGEEPGIPLNTQYGLLIYTRGHRLYRWGKAKQRALLNNAKTYSLNSRIGGLIGIADADISDEGKTWEISLTNKGYSETTSQDWLYNGVDFSKYWDAPYLVSLLMSMKKLPDKYFRWFLGNKENTVEQIINDTKATDEASAVILYNGAITQTVYVGEYAKYAQNQVKHLLAEVQGSEFKSIFNCYANLTSAWIDAKGNWCGIVAMSAYGRGYKNYNVTIRLPGEAYVYQYGKYNISWYTGGGKGIDYTRARPVEFIANYSGNWFIENGALVAPVYESWDMGANEDGGYLNTIDRRLVTGEFQDGSAFFYGIRRGTKSTQMSEHIELPSSSSKKTGSCLVPLQEDYAIRYDGAKNMPDSATVYKNGAELFKHSGGVYRVTALNEKKGEYLFIGDKGVYIVQNGEVKQVFWKGNSIHPGNWRLHYMNNLGDLRRDETKIP